MARTDVINALKSFENAENNDEALLELRVQLDCAFEGECTTSEIEDIAQSFLNLP